MRRKEKEIQDKSKIEEILKNARVCRLAMVDGNEPYIVPMNFGYSENCLYFHSAAQGRKIDLLKKNPNICFEVDELIALKKASQACDWGASFKSVIGTGTASLVNTPDEKKNALDVIMAQYSKRSFIYPEDMLEKTAVIRVDILQMTGKQSPA